MKIIKIIKQVFYINSYVLGLLKMNKDKQNQKINKNKTNMKTFLS